MRHLRLLQIITITTITLLASCGNNDRTDTASNGARPSEGTPIVAETSVESCVRIGDAFQLDAPGTYTAFAMRSGESLATEVRGSHGELLATKHQTMSTTAAVDFPSGLRFGIAPPEVFEVESTVTIHIEHNDLPYELVLVRIDGTTGFSDLNLRPPVERIVNESGSCLIGGLRETFKIHTEAVYSDISARQVFLVDSPNRLVDY